MKKNILFVYPALPTFIKRDYEILKKYYEIVPVHITKNLLKSLGEIILKIKKADLIFVWFAGLHGFLAILFAKIFRKKSLVICGGYDTTCVHEIDYGIFCSWWRGWLARFVYRNVDKIAVVDDSLKKEILKHIDFEIEEKIVTVPTGYDHNKWKPSGKKRGMVLTVANVKKSNIKRKGLECFVKVARNFPKTEFVVVGTHTDNSIDYLRSIATKNAKFTGFVSDQKLLNFYQKSKIYCQLSRFEGLPNALCEGMLCECIPIGTKYCGIQKAIGNTGFFVPYENVEETSKAVREALNLKENHGKKARERIKGLFPEERRKKELINLIEKLI